MEAERSRLASIKVNLQRRALVYELVRTFFREQSFLEVETPIRVPCVAPESYIIPFESEDWFLSTSPELYMKRLLAAGYEKIFQFSHSFRKEEQGRLHNPEFTLLEWYRAGGSYADVIHDTELLVLTLTETITAGHILNYGDRAIDLSLPWPRITVRDAFLQYAGWDPVAIPDALRFDMDLVTEVMPHFRPDRPTILTDYPAAMASLARLKPGQSDVAERAEVFIGGLELANAYSELRDGREQEKRFREEIAHISNETGRKAGMPHKFIEALATFPECGGIALGVDRLVMLLCDARSIGEVIPFTADTA